MQGLGGLLLRVLALAWGTGCRPVSHRNAMKAPLAASCRVEMNQGMGNTFSVLLLTMLKMMLKAYHRKMYTGIFQGARAGAAGAGLAALLAVATREPRREPALRGASRGCDCNVGHKRAKGRRWRQQAHPTGGYGRRRSRKKPRSMPTCCSGLAQPGQGPPGCCSGGRHPDGLVAGANSRRPASDCRTAGAGVVLVTEPSNRAAGAMAWPMQGANG